MTHLVRYTMRASADLDRMVNDLKRTSGAPPVAWFQRLTAAIESLSALPERCHQAAEAHDLSLDLRELIVGRRRGTVRVLFTIEESVVNVLHLRWAIHGLIRPEDLT